MDDKRRLILDQALALVDERGLAAMSMRAVAERVGLTSMALYPYVGGKDALLDGLVDLLHLELGTAVGDDVADIDWRRRLRALGRAVRALAHAHPGAFPLLLNRSAAGASASWLTAALRGILHDARVPDARIPRLARMICAFLLGYTTGEITGGLPTTGPSAGPGTDQSAGPTAGPDADQPAGAFARSDADQPGGPIAGRGAHQPAGSIAAPGADQPAGPIAARGAEQQAGHTAGPPAGAGGEPAGSGEPGDPGREEFEADLADLVRLVEVAVRVG